ncbi:MAG TPA: ABC transporter transmembrane domain-containing protein [Acidimicrobiales bacterium]
MTTALRAFLVYLRPYRALVALLVAGLVVELLFTTAMPLAFKYLIDDAIPNRDRGLLWTVLGVMAGAVLLAGFTAMGRDYLYAKLGSNVMNDLRLRMFEHLQRLSAGYYARQQIGDILARFSTDLAAVRNAVVLAIPETVLGFLGVVVYSAVLLYLEPALAIVAILGLPTLLIGPRLLSARAEREGLRVRDQEAAITSTVQEAVSTSGVIRAFGLADSRVQAFRSELDVLHRRSVRFNLLSYLVERTPNIAFLLLQVAVMAVGALMAFRGRLEIGSLVAFNAIVLSLSGAITSLTRIMPLLLEASGGVQRIATLLDETPSVADGPGAQDLTGFEERITFEDVTFSYAGGKNQLENVSFQIERGMKVAFVGGSGSGKSTVLTLVQRFYDPQQGAVRFDGHDVRTVSQQSLRRLFGVVFQESLLFNTTVAENIRTGKLDATDEQVKAAAAAAELVEVVDGLPDGYDTLVGERGGRLSGGQRQRVAIARALARDPAILLLDEATSALDPATEASVDATLKRVGRDRTVVAVSHRLASVVDYDRIFVMSDGRLVEYGTHPELLARGGVYHQLWRKQQGVSLSDDGRLATVTAEYLRSVPGFGKLAPEVISTLSRRFVTEHYPEDRAVIHEGDTPADKFYVIVRGKVAVTKAAEDGTPRQLAVRGDGDYFGEIALVRDVPRIATVTTLTPCVLLSLRRDDFLVLLQTEPVLRQEIAALVAARTAETEV